MITYLKLTNFKRHENLEVSFTEGLQLIRAGSEAGKSTMLQAIAYALYGARALPMSLAETVTYDKPESTLRVLLRFSFNGSEFEIERHKGGAELRGDGVTASGQAEVTAFVDRLFNCNAAVANSLMFANQGALRGALEGGSGAAVSLIEKLADVDALDRLVAKAQENLPSGNTKLLEHRISELQAITKPEADFTNLELAVVASEGEAYAMSQVLKAQEAMLAGLDTQAAQEAVAHATQARRALESLQAAQVRLLPAADYEAPVSPDIESLRAEAAAAAEAVLLRKQHKQFLAFTQYPKPLWDSEAQMKQHQQELESAVTIHTATLRRLTQAQTQAEMSIIKEDLCGFCGKSFADVPEVIAKNAQCAEVAAKVRAETLAVEIALGCTRQNLQALREAVEFQTKAERAMVGLPVEACPGFPTVYLWKGGDVTAPDAQPDYPTLIRQAENLIETVRTKTAQAQAAQEQLKNLDLPGAELALKAAEAKVGPANDTIAQATDLKFKISATRDELRRLEAVMNKDAHALAMAKLELDAAERTYAAAQQNLQQARADLSTYLLNNRVIKKIRDARPLVAKQLWGTVLGTVSHYFSQVRGTPSIVTREGSGFLVDGKAVEGLSGSTLDALGLAIRIALTRTFLSNVSWLILDEPGAACDDAREAAMLGVVSSCGFPQVIMVSHSDVGDTYAANVITF